MSKVLCDNRNALYIGDVLITIRELRYGNSEAPFKEMSVQQDNIFIVINTTSVKNGQIVELLGIDRVITWTPAWQNIWYYFDYADRQIKHA